MHKIKKTKRLGNGKTTHLEYNEIVIGESVKNSFAFTRVSLCLSPVVVFHSDNVTYSFPSHDSLCLFHYQQIDVHKEEGMTCSKVLEYSIM